MSCGTLPSAMPTGWSCTSSGTGTRIVGVTNLDERTHSYTHTEGEGERDRDRKWYIWCRELAKGLLFEEQLCCLSQGCRVEPSAIPGHPGALPPPSVLEEAAYPSERMWPLPPHVPGMRATTDRQQWPILIPSPKRPQSMVGSRWFYNKVAR